MNTFVCKACVSAGLGENVKGRHPVGAQFYECPVCGKIWSTGGRENAGDTMTDYFAATSLPGPLPDPTQYKERDVPTEEEQDPAPKPQPAADHAPEPKKPAKKQPVAKKVPEPKVEIKDEKKPEPESVTTFMRDFTFNPPKKDDKKKA